MARLLTALSGKVLPEPGGGSSAGPDGSPATVSLSREQFRELLMGALDDPAAARLVARRLLLPAFPIQGGGCAGPSAKDITSGDFGSNCSDAGNYTFAGGGKVGIGTTTPGGLLDISAANVWPLILRNTDSFNGYGASMELVNTGPGGRTYALMSTSNQNSAVFGGTFSIYDVTGNLYRLVINSSGSVGIGTATPGAMLDVAGSARVRSLNNVRYADAFDSVDIGNGISLAIQDLYNAGYAGGIIDARGYLTSASGTIACNTPPFPAAGPAGIQNVVILLPVATILTSVQWKPQGSNVRIIGQAYGHQTIIRLGAGTVNTSGTAVTWTAGMQFNTSGGWTNRAIMINGVLYTISGVTDATHLTLTTTAGTQTGAGYYLPPGYGGTVNASGTAVTWASGSQFFADGSWNNQAIIINGVQYTISGVTDATHLTLTTGAGAQTGVGYLVLGWLFDGGPYDGIAMEEVYFDGNYYNGQNPNSPTATVASGTGALRFGTSTIQDLIMRNVRIYNFGPPNGTSGAHTTCTYLDIGFTIDSRFEHVDVQPAAVPPYSSGYVTTQYQPTGTIVTWQSGNQFPVGGWGNQTIVINGVAYTVASVTDVTHLTLTTSPASQAQPVSYSVTPIMSLAANYVDTYGLRVLGNGNVYDSCRFCGHSGAGAHYNGANAEWFYDCTFSGNNVDLYYDTSGGVGGCAYFATWFENSWNGITKVSPGIPTVGTQTFTGNKTVQGSGSGTTVAVQTTASSTTDTAFSVITPTQTWKLGQNVGGAGANTFDIYDVTGGANRLKIDTSGKATFNSPTVNWSPVSSDQTCSGGQYFIQAQSTLDDFKTCENGTLLPSFPIATYDAAGTVLTRQHAVSDAATLSGGMVTVNLSPSAAFGGSSTYRCVAVDTTAANAVWVEQTSGSQFKIHGSGSDTVQFTCIGGP